MSEISDKLNSLIVVCGVSGAGKTSAQNILEDLGYHAIHNLPVRFLQQFLDYSLTLPDRFSKIALSPDLHSTESAIDLAAFIENCKKQGVPTYLIFIDCKTEVLVKRYSESRRPHPEFDAQRDQSLKDTIDRERTRLAQLKDLANLRIDSSETTVHALKRTLQQYVDSLSSESMVPTRVNFLSFGFKYGVPYDCDLVMDVRFLPNPHFVSGLRQKTGLENEVADYVLSSEVCIEFVAKYLDLLQFLIPKYVHEGKSYINIGIGCTGGKHRSVALAEHFAKSLKIERCLISAKHRDLGNE